MKPEFIGNDFDWGFVREIAGVLTEGKADGRGGDYKQDGYRKQINAACRHMIKLMEGTMIDESGNPEIIMVAVRLMLAWRCRDINNPHKTKQKEKK